MRESSGEGYDGQFASLRHRGCDNTERCELSLAQPANDGQVVEFGQINGLGNVSQRHSSAACTLDIDREQAKLRRRGCL